MLIILVTLYWSRLPRRDLRHLRAGLTVGFMIITVALGDCVRWAHGQDRYNPQATTSLLDREHRDIAQLAQAKPANEKQLREGTLIPTTVGQIVLLGRRWAFVPLVESENPDVIANASSLGSSPSSRLASHRSKPRPTRLGAATAGLTQRRTLASKDEDPVALGPKLSRMIISENLMLQRIVEAIRADASDDRWAVSGEVTEFFNENRLLIRTAQRANAD